MSWDGIHHLIVRAKAGDNDAWQSLHDMVCPYMLNLGQRLLGPAWPHQSVSDLTQETWQRVLVGIPGFRGGEDDGQTAPLFRAWLCQTMKRVHANRIRAERAQRRKAPLSAVPHSGLGPVDSNDGRSGSELIAAGSSVGSNLCREEERALIQRVLDHLEDPLDREFVQAHFVEGRSLRKLAKERGTSEHELRNRRQSILKRLGRDLKALQ
jgi:RNA polymerase sigma factor (sigma-70 family)